ncbi:MAG: glycosyltransferase family 4 protein [Phycisphaerae bacterium]
MAAACLVAAGISLLLGGPVRRLGAALGIMDKPGRRSSHSMPVPRTGGIAIIAGAMVAMALFGKPNMPLLAAAAFGTLVAAISLIDDIFTVPSLIRLVVHLLVAGTVIGLVGLEPQDLGLPYLSMNMNAWTGAILAVLFTVGFVNFFNFMDGINGIAAFQGILGAGMIGVLLMWGGADNSVLVAAAMAGGCLGFLPHNFPKARMFMGDVGSTTLGFCLSMLTLVGGCRSELPWVAYILPLGVFIYDATFTLIKRIIRRENFLQAHREHHYQLLIRSGWSHTKVALLQAALMAMFCASAVIYTNGDDMSRLLVLAADLALMGTYSVFVHRTFARHPAKTGEGPAG